MFTRIDLQFFKRFKLLRLPLAPLTLPTGLNASGKSSVLQALAFLHQIILVADTSRRTAIHRIYRCENHPAIARGSGI